MNNSKALLLSLLTSATLAGCGSADDNSENSNNDGGADNQVMSDADLIRALGQDNNISTDSIDGTWMVLANGTTYIDNTQSRITTSTVLTIDTNHGLTMALCSNGNGTSASDSSYAANDLNLRKVQLQPDEEDQETDASVFNMPYAIINKVFDLTLNEGGNYQASISEDNSTITFETDNIALLDNGLLNTSMTFYKIRDESFSPIGILDWNLGDAFSDQADAYCFQITTIEESASGDVNLVDGQYDISTNIHISNDQDSDQFQSLEISHSKEFNDEGEVTKTSKRASFTRGNGNVTQAREVTPAMPDDIVYGQYNLNSLSEDILHHSGDGSITGQDGSVLVFNLFELDLTLPSEAQPEPEQPTIFN